MYRRLLVLLTGWAFFIVCLWYRSTFRVVICTLMLVFLLLFHRMAQSCSGFSDTGKDLIDRATASQLKYRLEPSVFHIINYGETRNNKRGCS